MNSAKHWFNAVDRLTSLFGQVTGAISAWRTAGAMSPQAAKLEVLMAKVTRAKAVTEKLQQLQNREAALKHQYTPLLQRVRGLQQQLSANEVHKMERFAESKGLQPLLAQLAGGEHGADAALSDPFGVLLALSPSDPNAPMSWVAYLAALRKVQHTADTLDGPSLEQLQLFARQWRLLLAEMRALQHQLKGEMELPALEPTERQLQSLHEFVSRVGTAQKLHFRMLQRDLAKLQLGMLEIKLKIDMGDDHRGSEEEELLRAMHTVSHSVLERQQLPSVQALEQFCSSLQRLAAVLQARRGGKHRRPTLSTLAEGVVRSQ